IPLFLQLIASAIISGLCFIFQKPSFGTNRLLHLLHLYLCFLLDLLYRNPAFTMSAEFLQKIHFTVISITSEISEMNLYINMPKIKLYPEFPKIQKLRKSLTFANFRISPAT